MEKKVEGLLIAEKLAKILAQHKVPTQDSKPLLIGDEILNLFYEELDKAREEGREEGYQNCMDDIWEEARELRGWTEHDGNVSATDIEAGLEEAYLNIENKLRQ